MTCEEDLCSENGEDQRKSLIIAAKGGQTEISVPWVRLDARLASGRLLSREMVQGVCRRRHGLLSSRRGNALGPALCDRLFDADRLALDIANVAQPREKSLNMRRSREREIRDPRNAGGLLGARGRAGERARRGDAAEETPSRSMSGKEHSEG